MSERANEMSVGRETSSSLIARLMMSVLGFVGIIVFAHELGPSGVGHLYFIISVMIITIQVPRGISTGLGKRVSEVGADPREYLTIALVLHIGYVSLVAAGAFLATPVLAPLFGGSEFIFIYLVLSAVVGLFSIINGVHRGLGYPARAVWADTLRSVFTLGMQLAFLWLGYKVFGVLTGLAAGTVGGVIALGFLMRIRPTADVSRKHFNALVGFTKWSAATSLVREVFIRFDILFLSLVIGSTVAGYYESAFKLSIPGTLIAYSIGETLLVKTSAVASRGDDVQTDVSNSITFSGLLAIPVLFGAAAISSDIMAAVFGAEFAPGGPILVATAVVFVFRAYRIPLTNTLYGLDRPRLVFLLVTGALSINTIGSVLVVGEYGPIGVVAATAVAEAVLLGGCFCYVRDVTGKLLKPLDIAGQVLAGGVMYGVVRVADVMLPSYASVPTLRVALLIGCGGVVYCGLVMVLSPATREVVTYYAASHWNRLS